MFRQNIRLANSIVSKVSAPFDPALDKEDLIQEAYIGLWIACKNFDPSQGTAFSTYAVPTIKGKVYRTLRDSGTLREPRSWKNIRHLMDKYNMTLPLSEHDIDVLLSDTSHRVSRRALIQFFSMEGVLYLDDSVASDSTTTLGELIPDMRSTYSELSEDEMEKIVDSLIQYVKVQYQDLVEEWMYSVLEGYRITQSDLGAKYGFSQVQVHRILKQSTTLIALNRQEVFDALAD